MRSRSQLMRGLLLAGAAALLAGACAPVQTAQGPEIHPDIHFVPTSNGVVETMLQLARVTSGDVVYDLGSGDGRIPIAAARDYGARAVGIEIDPALIRQSIASAEKAGVSDRVSFRQADLFKTDFSEATVVTMYLSPTINLRLRDTLQHLRPGTRVVSNRFSIPDWPADREVRAGGRTIYLWIVKPAAP